MFTGPSWLAVSDGPVFPTVLECLGELRVTEGRVDAECVILSGLLRTAQKLPDQAVNLRF